jgi:hypothetical protein
MQVHFIATPGTNSISSKQWLIGIQIKDGREMGSLVVFSAPLVVLGVDQLFIDGSCS